MKPLFPSWYNENAQYEYHLGNGHSLENYTILKYRVQDIIKARALTFEDMNSPNLNANPMPNHVRAKVNAIDGEIGRAHV